MTLFDPEVHFTFMKPLYITQLENLALYFCVKKEKVHTTVNLLAAKPHRRRKYT